MLPQFFSCVGLRNAAGKGVGAVTSATGKGASVMASWSSAVFKKISKKSDSDN